MTNKRVRAIASIMIVLLAILLIVIFISYNNREYRYVRPSNMHVSGDSRVQKKSGDVVKKIDEVVESGDEEAELSGEAESDIIVESGEDYSGDENTGKEEYNEEATTKPEKRPGRKNPSENTPIIVSRTETSNQEKQEVLNEIDDALKDLLDAVGKVKTVDESKLDASLGSEVEP